MSNKRNSSAKLNQQIRTQNSRRQGRHEEHQAKFYQQRLEALVVAEFAKLRGDGFSQDEFNKKLRQNPGKAKQYAAGTLKNQDLVLDTGVAGDYIPDFRPIKKSASASEYAKGFFDSLFGVANEVAGFAYEHRYTLMAAASTITALTYIISLNDDENRKAEEILESVTNAVAKTVGNAMSSVDVGLISTALVGMTTGSAPLTALYEVMRRLQFTGAERAQDNVNAIPKKSASQRKFERHKNRTAVSLATKKSLQEGVRAKRKEREQEGRERVLGLLQGDQDTLFRIGAIPSGEPTFNSSSVDSGILGNEVSPERSAKADSIISETLGDSSRSSNVDEKSAIDYETSTITVSNGEVFPIHFVELENGGVVPALGSEENFQSAPGRRLLSHLGDIEAVMNPSETDRITDAQLVQLPEKNDFALLYNQHGGNIKMVVYSRENLSIISNKTVISDLGTSFTLRFDSAIDATGNLVVAARNSDKTKLIVAVVNSAHNVVKNFNVTVSGGVDRPVVEATDKGLVIGVLSGNNIKAASKFISDTSSLISLQDSDFQTRVTSVETLYDLKVVRNGQNVLITANDGRDKIIGVDYNFDTFEPIQEISAASTNTLFGSDLIAIDDTRAISYHYEGSNTVLKILNGVGTGSVKVTDTITFPGRSPSVTLMDDGDIAVGYLKSGLPNSRTYSIDKDSNSFTIVKDEILLPGVNLGSLSGITYSSVKISARSGGGIWATFTGSSGDRVIYRAEYTSSMALDSTIEPVDQTVGVQQTLAVLQDQTAYRQAKGNQIGVVSSAQVPDDPAVIDGDISGLVIEDEMTQVSGNVTLVDPNVGDNPYFLNVNQPIQGIYGTLFFSNATNSWKYDLDPEISQSLNENEIKKDIFALVDSDDTSHNLAITIIGTKDQPIFEGEYDAVLVEDLEDVATKEVGLTRVDSDDNSEFVGIDNPPVYGAYGSLVFETSPDGLSGNWTYRMNNTLVQGLRENVTVTDIIPVETNTGYQRNVTISITGTDDEPVVSGDFSGRAIEDLQIVAEGEVHIDDVDIGDNVYFNNVTQPINGLYGRLTYNNETNKWRYALNNNQDIVQELNDGEEVLDQFVLLDSNRNPHSLVVNITGTLDNPEITGDFFATMFDNSQDVVQGQVQVRRIDSGDNSEFNDITNDDPALGVFGQLTLINGTWSYTPNSTLTEILPEGRTVTDIITLQTNTGFTRNIRVNITGTDQAPFITGDFSGFVKEDNIIRFSGEVQISDVDDGQDPYFLDATVTTPFGILEVVDGEYEFSLNNNSTLVQGLGAGDVRFQNVTLIASDGSEQDISIRIEGTDDQPQVSGVFTGKVIEELATSVSGTVVISDVDVDDVPFFPDVDNQVTPNGNFTMVNGTWTFDLNPDVQVLANGEQIFQNVTITDSNGEQYTVGITIEGKDGHTIISGLASGVVVDPNSLVAEGSLVVSNEDRSKSPYLFNVTDPVVTPYGDFTMINGNWKFNATNSQGLISLADGQVAYQNVTVVANDGTTQDITIELIGKDDQPQVSGVFMGHVIEDGKVFASGSIAISDVDDGQSPYFADVTDFKTEYGVVNLRGGNWSYVLDPEFQGLSGGERRLDNVTFTASDGTQQVISIEVEGRDGQTVVSGVTTGSVIDKNQTFATGALVISNEDFDKDPNFLNVTTPVKTPYGEFFMESGVWSFNATGSQAAAELADGQVAYQNVTVVANDGTTQDITIKVVGVDDKAVVDGVFMGKVIEELATSVSGTVVISDVDVDDVPFFPDVDNQVTPNGNFTMVNGTWTFDLNPDVQVLANGEQIFQNVTITDSNGEQYTVGITIEGKDGHTIISGLASGVVVDPNSLVAEGSLVVSNEDRSKSPYLFNVTDPVVTPYGDFTMINGNWKFNATNSQGLISLADGQVAYQNVTVVANDGTTQDITIELIGKDDQPQVSGVFMGHVIEDGKVFASGSIAISDVDDGQSPYFADVTDFKTEYGVVNLRGGNWSYVLDPEFQGLSGGERRLDNVTFTASDGTQQVISIEVEGRDGQTVVSGVTTGSVIDKNQTFATGALVISNEDFDKDPNFLNVTTPVKTPYGEFFMESGVWSFNATGSQAAAELADGQVAYQNVTVVANDGTTQDITIKVVGVDDKAVVDGVFMGKVIEELATSVSGTVVISDVDVDDVPFFPDVDNQVTPNGNFTMVNGTWTFDLNPDVQVLANGEQIFQNVTITDSNGEQYTVGITIEGKDGHTIISGLASGVVVDPNSLVAEGSLVVSNEDRSKSPYLFNVTDPVVTPYGDFTMINGNWKFNATNSQGLISLADGQVAYQNVTVVANDGTTQDITIKVVGVDNKAVVDGVFMGTVIEDGISKIGGNITISDIDNGQNPRFLDSEQQTPFGNFTLANGRWDFVLDSDSPASNALGLNDIRVLTFDAQADDDTMQSIKVIIRGSNDGPIISDVEMGEALVEEIVYENMPVATILAHELDQNATLTYVFPIDFNLDGRLRIDNITGEIFATQTLVDDINLDTGTEQDLREIPIKVNVIDEHGAVSAIETTVDITRVNDNPPTLAADRVNTIVEERVHGDDVVAVIYYNDLDFGANTTLSLPGNNSNFVLRDVGNKTVEVVITADGAMAANSDIGVDLTKFEFPIQVSDGIFTDQIEIDVDVTRVNDQTPVVMLDNNGGLGVEIRVNQTTPGMTLGSFSMMDLDDQDLPNLTPTLNLTSPEFSDYFELDFANKTIILSDQGYLDIRNRTLNITDIRAQLMVCDGLHCSNGVVLPIDIDRSGYDDIGVVDPVTPPANVTIPGNNTLPGNGTDIPPANVTIPGNNTLPGNGTDIPPANVTIPGNNTLPGNGTDIPPVNVTIPGNNTLPGNGTDIPPANVTIPGNNTLPGNGTDIPPANVTIPGNNTLPGNGTDIPPVNVTIPGNNTLPGNGTDIPPANVTIPGNNTLPGNGTDIPPVNVTIPGNNTLPGNGTDIPPVNVTIPGNNTLPGNGTDIPPVNVTIPGNNTLPGNGTDIPPANVTIPGNNTLPGNGTDIPPGNGNTTDVIDLDFFPKECQLEVNSRVTNETIREQISESFDDLFKGLNLNQDDISLLADYYEVAKNDGIVSEKRRELNNNFLDRLTAEQINDIGDTIEAMAASDGNWNPFLDDKCFTQPGVTEPEKGSSSDFPLWIIAVGLGVISAAGYAYYRRRNRNSAVEGHEQRRDSEAGLAAREAGNDAEADGKAVVRNMGGRSDNYCSDLDSDSDSSVQSNLLKTGSRSDEDIRPRGDRGNIGNYNSPRNNNVDNSFHSVSLGSTNTRSQNSPYNPGHARNIKQFSTLLGLEADSKGTSQTQNQAPGAAVSIPQKKSRRRRGERHPFQATGSGSKSSDNSASSTSGNNIQVQNALGSDGSPVIDSMAERQQQRRERRSHIEYKRGHGAEGGNQSPSSPNRDPLSPLKDDGRLQAAQRRVHEEKQKELDAKYIQENRRRLGLDAQGGGVLANSEESDVNSISQGLGSVGRSIGAWVPGDAMTTSRGATSFEQPEQPDLMGYHGSQPSSRPTSREQQVGIDANLALSLSGKAEDKTR